MNAKKKQYGQGIGGFIFGLLLATAIIGGILYFLNNTKAEYKEIPQSQELPKPEILVPSSAGSGRHPRSRDSQNSNKILFLETLKKKEFSPVHEKGRKPYSNVHAFSMAHRSQ